MQLTWRPREAELPARSERSGPGQHLGGAIQLNPPPPQPSPEVAPKGYHLLLLSSQICETTYGVCSAWLMGSIWERFCKLQREQPELEEDIRGVMNAITGGCAKLTITAYSSWLKKFTEFCNKIRIPINEVMAAEAVLFLQGITKQGYPGSTDVQAQAVLSWGAQIADRDDH